MFRESDGNYVITDPFSENYKAERIQYNDKRISKVINHLVSRPEGINKKEIDDAVTIPGGKRRPKKLKKLLRKYGEKAIHYGEKEDHDNDMKI